MSEFRSKEKDSEGIGVAGWPLILLTVGGLLAFFPYTRSVGILLLGCGALVWGVKSQRLRSQYNARIEHIILEAAQSHAGILTPALLALQANITIDSATRFLEEFCKRGICSMELTGNGKVEYRFPDFLPEQSSPNENDES